MMDHRCHARGCTRPVAPNLLMCLAQWQMVPGSLKRDVWATYRRGQETRKDPSPAYLAAARAAIESVAREEGFPR